MNYDGKHVIAVDGDYEQVQEGWRRKGWINLANGTPTESIFYGAAATKELATALVKEQAISAIIAGTIKYCDSNDPSEGMSID